MTQEFHIKETGKVLCFVGLPDASIDFCHIYELKDRFQLWCRSKGKFNLSIEITSGFEYIGLKKDLTNEQLDGVVYKMGGLPNWAVYKDYFDPYSHCMSPVNSLYSLMRHLKLYEANPHGELHKAIRSGTARSKDGAEKDRVNIVHLVDSNDYPSWESALCGINPKGNGWHYYTNGMDVTCERCNSKSMQWQEAQSRTFENWAVLVRNA